MITYDASRRAFLIASMGLAAAEIARPHATQTITAGQAIDRIKANVGIP